jgi:hypothetical protein
MVNERVKVIVPEVGASPTLVIWNVYDPRTPGSKVVGPVMLGVRSGTGAVVVVVVVGGCAVVAVVVVVDGAAVVVVVVAGAGAAAEAVGGHESSSWTVTPQPAYSAGSGSSARAGNVLSSKCLAHLDQVPVGLPAVARTLRSTSNTRRLVAPGTSRPNCFKVQPL